MNLLARSAVILVALTLVATPAWADRLKELEENLRLMQQQQQQVLEDQKRLIQEIERLKTEKSRPMETAPPRDDGRARRLAEEPLRKIEGGQAPATKETLSIERLLVTRGNILLRQGDIEIEPSVQYAHFASQLLSVTGFAVLPSLVIGQISTQRIQRDIIIPALTVRGGIFDWLQADVSVPYRYQQDRITDSLATVEALVENQGIGDIETGLSLQVLRERRWVPDVILSFRYKSRTGEDPFEVEPVAQVGGTTVFEPALGTGFETFRPGFTLVKSVDPAIVFTGFGMLFNKPRDITFPAGLEARIAPGNGYEFNSGIAFAINPDVSLNIQYVQRVTSHTKFNDFKLPGSTLNAGTVNLGFTWALFRALAMDVTLGIGVTEDAPDVTAQIRFPFRFSLK